MEKVVPPLSILRGGGPDSGTAGQQDSGTAGLGGGGQPAVRPGAALEELALQASQAEGRAEAEPQGVFYGDLQGWPCGVKLGDGGHTLRSHPKSLPFCARLMDSNISLVHY